MCPFDALILNNSFTFKKHFHVIERKRRFLNYDGDIIKERKQNWDNCIS